MLNKLPYILSAIYDLLVILSIIPIFTGDDPLSGIFAIVLTAPWSSLLGNWLGGGSMTVGLMVILVGALINSTIILFVTRWLVSRLA